RAFKQRELLGPGNAVPRPLVPIGRRAAVDVELELHLPWIRARYPSRIAFDYAHLDGLLPEPGQELIQHARHVERLRLSLDLEGLVFGGRQGGQEQVVAEGEVVESTVIECRRRSILELEAPCRIDRLLRSPSRAQARLGIPRQERFVEPGAAELAMDLDE